jgi:hypothetical protein
MLIVNSTAAAYPRLPETPVQDFLTLKSTAAGACLGCDAECMSGPVWVLSCSLHAPPPLFHVVCGQQLRPTAPCF